MCYYRHYAVTNNDNAIMINHNEYFHQHNNVTTSLLFLSLLTSSIH